MRTKAADALSVRAGRAFELLAAQPLHNPLACVVKF